MVYCMAFGCSNDSRNTTAITYHRLPKDQNQRIEWLAKISRENPTLSKNSVVCSEHFTTECFERDFKAELLGTRAKTRLKSDAVPTIFSHRIPSKKPRLSSVSRQLRKEKREYLATVLNEPEVESTPISCGDDNLPSSTTTSVTNDSFTQCAIETREISCQVNTYAHRRMLKTVETQTEDLSLFNVCEISTQTEVEKEEKFDDDTEDELCSSQETVYPSESIEPVTPIKDRLKYLPEPSSSEVDQHSSCSGSNSEHDDGEFVRPQDDRKFIVFKDELNQLFKWCCVCGAAVVNSNTSMEGHNHTWLSQPLFGRMAAGNLLLSSAILLSGSTYMKIFSFAEILNLQFLCEKSFYHIQDSLLFPVINDFWTNEQNMLVEEIGENEIWLSGDGRCDSPGHNAKYCTYTVIDQETDKILDLHTVQVSEVANSNAMEREAFKRCMGTFADNAKTVTVMATDRHIGISADMKRDYPGIEHQYDVWHLSKSIKKKLTEKAKKKGCDGLFLWIKSVSNHLWWCAEACDGDKNLLTEMWVSVIYHTAGIHSWDGTDYYKECPHEVIPPDEDRLKRWLTPGSPAHDALKEVVLNKKIVGDIQKLNLCCHTGSLEVYHNVMTKYAPKRQHFSYKGMVARTQLAALDHNANTGRDQARTEGGELRYKVVYPKQTKDWVAKPVFEKTKRDHLNPLLDAIIERKFQDRDDRSSGVSTDHISDNIARVPRPPKNEVVTRLTTRFGHRQ